MICDWTEYENIVWKRNLKYHYFEKDLSMFYLKKGETFVVFI